jgi:hypothetical protein
MVRCDATTSTYYICSPLPASRVNVLALHPKSANSLESPALHVNAPVSPLLSRVRLQNQRFALMFAPYFPCHATDATLPCHHLCHHVTANSSEDKFSSRLPHSTPSLQFHVTVVPSLPVSRVPSITRISGQCPRITSHINNSPESPGLPFNISPSLLMLTLDKSSGRTGSVTSQSDMKRCRLTIS